MATRKSIEEKDDLPPCPPFGATLAQAGVVVRDSHNRVVCILPWESAKWRPWVIAKSREIVASSFDE